jgi:nicotinamidase-related amidase
MPKNDIKKSSVLLVIDVQMIMFEPVPVYQANLVLKNIKSLIAYYRQHHLPIIFIQHDGTEEQPFGIGKPGWTLHKDIFTVGDEILIHKNFPDAFQKTDLNTILKELEINDLVIVGMQTEYCIDTTCRSAFSLGYNVTLVEDAHSTMDGSKSQISAKQKINHHNNVLGSCFANVQPTQKILLKPLKSRVK